MTYNKLHMFGTDLGEGDKVAIHFSVSREPYGGKALYLTFKKIDVDMNGRKEHKCDQPNAEEYHKTDWQCPECYQKWGAKPETWKWVPIW